MDVLQATFSSPDRPRARAWLAGAVLTLAAAAAQATVIDFDHNGVPGSDVPLTAPIAGFVFNTDIDVVDISPGSQSGLSFTGPAHSGDYAAANNGFDNTLQRADGATFSFQSLWVRQWGGEQPSDFTAIGLLNGVQVASATITATSTWDKLNGNFGQVDTVIFQHSDYFLIDDVLVNASPAPEPSGWAMLLAGLGLAAWTARRRARG